MKTNECGHDSFYEDSVLRCMECEKDFRNAADSLAELVKRYKGPCGCDRTEQCDLHEALSRYQKLRA